MPASLRSSNIMREFSSAQSFKTSSPSAHSALTRKTGESMASWKRPLCGSLVARYEAVVRSEFVQMPLGMWRRSMRRARPWCAEMIEKVWFQILMFMITVYALVGDDIRMSANTSKADDIYFNIVTTAALILFSFEFVCSCVGKEDYPFSFFFWLDLVATASLLLDITWIYENLILGGDTSVARAGRMSRVGTRAGRVIRVIRLLRLIRILKLYRHVLDVRSKMNDKAPEEKARPGKESTPTDEEVYAESRVGQKLSQMTTQKVIVLILSMLIMLPIISVEAWLREIPSAAQYGADMVNNGFMDCTHAQVLASAANDNSTQFACGKFEEQLALYIGTHHLENYENCATGLQKAFNGDCKLGLGWVGFMRHDNETLDFRGFQEKSFDEHVQYLFENVSSLPGTLRPDLAEHLNSGNPAVCEDVPDRIVYSWVPVLPDMQIVCPEDLRITEKTLIEPLLVPIGYDSPMIFVFDSRPYLLRAAVYSILQTVFICLILALGAMVFSRDANVLVLQPIERMIALVQKIRNNPLYAMKLGDESYRERAMYEEGEMMGERGSLLTAKRRFKSWRKLMKCTRRRPKTLREQTMETKILENAIVKLGKLLALGFGEAGSEIIVKNMGEDTATVNAMIPGSRVDAVFGFCDIRHFTDTTEVLQDKVMVFVNQVAEIVHSTVDAWHGAANRNIGQAFLIVWRMREEFDKKVRVKVIDMSVASFVQVFIAINKSPVLKDYREHPALLARIPNYRVRVGFGMHYGWAIEGAIGSEFKIDASYLSPHVKLASRLEAATRHYEVPIILSAPLASLCSPEMFRHFRAVDDVTFKGGMSRPIRLYSVDMHGDAVCGKYMSVNSRPAWQSTNMYEVRRQREKAKEEKMQESFKVCDMFHDDQDLVQMREHFSARFFQAYSKGFHNYVAGEWGVARTVFSSTVNMLTVPDGPSKALLEYMAQFDYDPSKVSSKGWPGHRELTEAEA